MTTAAVLFHERGVHATSVDDVLAASGAGKSQFYHHFSSKAELVREVLGYEFHRLQEEQAPLLERLDTWDGFVAWFDYIVRWQEGRGLLGGCPVGSLAAEMADRDDDLRADLADAFRQWESVVAGGLKTMRDRGELRADADPDALAEAVVAIQGASSWPARRRTSAPSNTSSLVPSPTCAASGPPPPAADQNQGPPPTRPRREPENEVSTPRPHRRERLPAPGEDFSPLAWPAGSEETRPGILRLRGPGRDAPLLWRKPGWGLVHAREWDATATGFLR